MLLTHLPMLVHVVAAQPLPEAGVLRVIRNAVIAILIVAFLVGGFLGFVIGRAFGRRER